MAITMNDQTQGFRQGIDNRHTDTMQAAGYLVGIVIKFSASMQHGHNNLGGRTSFFRVDIHRDATTVIGNGHRLIAVQDNGNFLAITSQRFIDGIVNHLKHHMVQTGTIIRITDVHTRTLAHRIQPF